MLRDYQLLYVKNVSDLIGRTWFNRRPNIKILDMGCETSGEQLREISELISGEVFGINVAKDFPSQRAMATAGPRVTLLGMSGLSLDFPDESFDLVISANVLEHVPSPGKFIKEAARVLKPNGTCWMETAPVWTSARGHHVMDCMITEACPWEKNYINDGSIIPDWSHLSLDRSEMEEIIGEKVSKETSNWILNYLYDSDDLNKAPLSEIEASLRSSFAEVRMHKNEGSGFDQTFMPSASDDDYLTIGFTACCRKRPLGGFRRRLCWRLRRLGL